MNSDFDKLERDWLYNGFKIGKVFSFNDALFDYLRPYSLGGIPVSILLFISEINNGHCYDRALLAQLAFDQCKLIHADLKSLRQRYGEASAEHAYIETNEFGGGNTWVVDTSMGLVYDKKYHDDFEKPKVNRVFTKEECMQSRLVQEVLASDFEEEKWLLVHILPNLEQTIENSNSLGTLLCRKKLREEIAKLKEAINFDAMQKEVREDMALMHDDPKALDKKFQIVRDQYCREISRCGV